MATCLTIWLGAKVSMVMLFMILWTLCSASAWSPTAPPSDLLHRTRNLKEAHPGQRTADFSSARGVEVGRRLQTGNATAVITAWAAQNPGATSLQLANQYLTGPLPALLSTLTSLQVLNLSGNLLTGPMPNLSPLTQLVSVDLSRNQLSGSVPSNLSPQLQVLNLTNNSFSGSIPSTISAAYPNLQLLDLGFNGLNGTIPNLGALTVLQSLRLHGNRLTGSVPPCNTTLSLFELWLHLNQLTGAVPATLGSLTNLTTLWLNGNRLSGSIPSAIGNLSNLVSLRLNNNALTGAIPSALGSLSNLQELMLFTNTLTGSIPSTLGSLTQLRLLQLSSNQLSGAIPSSLGNLMSLTSLLLMTNLLTGNIPTTLGSLSNLVELNIQGNQLTGPIPEALCNLQQLSILSIYSNSLTGTLPPCLGTLQNLTTLWIEKMSITGTIPRSYCNLVNVQTFILRLNQLTGTIPDCLGNLVNCDYLSLHTNQLTGSIPASLGNLQNLDQLWIHSNQLTGTIPDSLGNMSMLTQLWIYNNQLTGPIPSALGNLKLLSRASVSTNQLSGSIPDSIGALTNLTKFNFHVNSFTGPIPDSFAQLKLMQSVSFASNQLTGPVPAWIGNWSKILDIDLSNNQFTGPVPAGIGLMTSATLIRLSNNSLQGVIPDVFANMSALQTLNLDNNQLTGAIPNSIGNLSKLLILTLHNNQLNGTIPGSLTALPLLTTLSLYNNSLSGWLPDFSNSTNLTSLLAGYNQLRGATSMSSSIVQLDVSYNQIQALPPWNSLPNVQTLLLNNNNISSWPLRGVMARNSFTNEVLGTFICGRSVLLPQFSWPLLRRLDLSSNPLNTEARNLVWSVMSLPQLAKFSCRSCGLTLDIPRFFWLTSTGDRLCNGQQTLQQGFLQLTQLDLSFNSITLISDVPPPGLQIANLASNLLGSSGAGLVSGWWNSAYPRQYLISNLQVSNNPNLRLDFAQGPLSSTCDRVPITAGLSADFLGFTPFSSTVECTGLCNPPGLLYGTDRGILKPSALCRCAPGYAGSGQSCTPCGPNTYSFALDEFGMNRTCLPCPAGSVTSGGLQTSVCACQCPISTYLQGDDGGECSSSVLLLSNATCKSCGLLRNTTSSGSLRSTDCICDLTNVPNLTQFVGMCGCPNGYFFNTKTVACQPCSHEGEDCSWNGNMTRSLKPPDLLPGYWASTTARRLQAEAGAFTGHAIYRCFSKDICIDNLGTCAQGREGVACALCSPGWSGSPSKPCQQCSVPPGMARLGFIFGLFAAVWGVVVVLHIMMPETAEDEDDRKEKGRNARATAAVLLCLQQELSYAQIMSIVATSLAPVPPVLKQQLQQVQGVSVSFMDSVGTACLSGQQSPALELGFKWGFPLGVLLVGLTAPILGRPLGWLLNKFSGHHEVRKTLSRGFSSRINTLGHLEMSGRKLSGMGIKSTMQVLALLAIQSFSPTLVYNGLVLFTCLPQPNGIKTVMSYPYLQCSYQSQEYSRLFPISAAYLAAVLLLILVVQAIAWRNALQRLAKSGLKLRGRWRKFFDQFRTSHLHWAIFSSLVRDIAVNFLNAFFASDYRWRMVVIAFLLFTYSFATFVEQPFHTVVGNMSECMMGCCCAIVAVLLAIDADSSDGLMLAVCFMGFGVPPLLTLVDVASTLSRTRAYVPGFLRSFERGDVEETKDMVTGIMQKISLERLVNLDTMSLYFLKQFIATTSAFADTVDDEMTTWTAVRNLTMKRLRSRLSRGEYQPSEMPEETISYGLPPPSIINTKSNFSMWSATEGEGLDGVPEGLHSLPNAGPRGVGSLVADKGPHPVVVAM